MADGIAEITLFLFPDATLAVVTRATNTGIGDGECSQLGDDRDLGNAANQTAGVRNQRQMSRYDTHLTVD